MFALYFFLSIIGVIVLGIYMARTLGRATREVVPGLPVRARSTIKALYYLALYTFPVLVLVSLFYVLATHASSWVHMPESIWFDILLVYPFWLILVWSTQCVLFLLLLDVVRLIVRVLAPAHRPHWRRWHNRLILAVAVLFAVYVPARIVHDDQAIAVRRIEHRVAGLPEALDGFRIALVADLQADRYTGKQDLDQYVRAVNEQQADLILMAGDLITRGNKYIDVAAQHAGQMQATHGVYTCVGDHDNWAFGADMDRSVRAVGRALAARGVTMVDNDVITIDKAGARIAVIFLTENYMQRTNGASLGAMLEATHGADVHVVVTHQPNPAVIAKARKGGVDLYLAGHTHGGQITFWFPGLSLTPAALETPYVRGHYTMDDLSVVVSNGLGVSVVPFRYNATPTVDVIKLVRE